MKLRITPTQQEVFLGAEEVIVFKTDLTGSPYHVACLRHGFGQLPSLFSLFGYALENLL